MKSPDAKFLRKCSERSSQDLATDGEGCKETVVGHFWRLMTARESAILSHLLSFAPKTFWPAAKNQICKNCKCSVKFLWWSPIWWIKCLTYIEPKISPFKLLQDNWRYLPFTRAPVMMCFSFFFGVSVATLAAHSPRPPYLIVIILILVMTHSQMLGKVEYGLPAKIWRLVGCTEMLSW